MASRQVPALNLPEAPLRIEMREGKLHLFDELRRKWLVAQPEEWVRQHMVHFLMTHRGYPKSLIRLEAGQKVHGMARRSDILVYDRAMKPRLLVECKAPEVKITQQTFDQAAAYNTTLQAPLLVVTNGLQHFCCAIDFELVTYQWLQEIPAFEA